MQDIKGLTLEELKRTLRSWGESEFHAQQIFSWIYKKGILDFEAMSDLSFTLHKKLKENFCASSLKLEQALKSKDGTKKLLLKTKDKHFIEAVSIPAKARITGCISTQVGCKFSCAFCASGRLGLKRNLSVGEMLEEALDLKDNSYNGRLTHLVFMGIGEPLDNYENVIAAIRTINSPQGLHIAARRITISTCGIIPGIKRLSNEDLQIELSISLHAADGLTRTQIMPINKKYPLDELIIASREYIKKTNRQITFEYVLIKGVNSDLQNARNLSKILKGLNCKVNLIPANVIKELKVGPPNNQGILLFKDCLRKTGINVTLRKPRGEDIEAACGQLRLRYAEK